MSLINEALKRAQRDKNPQGDVVPMEPVSDVPPVQCAPAPLGAAPRPSGMRSRTMQWGLFGLVVILFAGAVVVVKYASFTPKPVQANTTPKSTRPQTPRALTGGKPALPPRTLVAKKDAPAEPRNARPDSGNDETPADRQLVIGDRKYVTAPHATKTASLVPPATQPASPDSPIVYVPIVPNRAPQAAAAATPNRPAAPLRTNPLGRFDESKYKLTGIVRGSGQDSTAVVNGQLVRVGQQVDDATVTRIDRYSIELEFQGKTYVISM